MCYSIVQIFRELLELKPNIATEIATELDHTERNQETLGTTGPRIRQTDQYRAQLDETEQTGLKRISRPVP
jgi:hypothetical protein